MNQPPVRQHRPSGTEIYNESAGATRFLRSDLQTERLDALFPVFEGNRGIGPLLECEQGPEFFFMTVRVRTRPYVFLV